MFTESEQTKKMYTLRSAPPMLR